MLGLLYLVALLTASAADEPTEDEPKQEEPTEEEPTEDEPIVIQLTPPGPVPSALDDLEEAIRLADDPAHGALLHEVLGIGQTQARLPLRSAFFVRPRVNLRGAHLDDGSRFGVGLGLAAGQRWWPLQQGRVRLTGENRIELDGIIGRVRGWQLTAVAAAGPWMGPLGLRVGPRFEVSRYTAGSSTLPGAAMLGAEASVAIDAGGVKIYGAVAPMWSTSSARAPGRGPLPTLGTETEWTGGLAVQTGWLVPRLELHVRSTDIGPLTTTLLGFQIRPKLRSATQEVKP